jgi:hypothetical protein
MERERIYCIRRSFVSESDSGIETLSLDGMAGSPPIPKLGTGRCWSLFRGKGLKPIFGSCRSYW